MSDLLPPLGNASAEAARRRINAARQRFLQTLRAEAPYLTVQELRSDNATLRSAADQIVFLAHCDG
jgi:F0F1-type ATP synthase membrane subunit b/b'